MVINPIVGVYIPIVRIPIKGGRFPIPNKTRLLTMAQIDLGRPGDSIHLIPLVGGDLSNLSTIPKKVMQYLKMAGVRLYLYIYLYSLLNPRHSMYGIFTYIYPLNYPNVGKYTIHWTVHWASGNVEAIWSLRNMENTRIDLELRRSIVDLAEIPTTKQLKVVA